MPTSKWVYNFHFEIISQWNRVWVNKLEVKFRLKVISSAQLIALLIRIKNSLRPQISVSLKFKLPIISAGDTNRVVETGENKSRWLVCSNFLFDLIMKTPSRNGQIKGAHPNINKIKGKKKQHNNICECQHTLEKIDKNGGPNCVSLDAPEQIDDPNNERWTIEIVAKQKRWQPKCSAVEWEKIRHTDCIR